MLVSQPEKCSLASNIDLVNLPSLSYGKSDKPKTAFWVLENLNIKAVFFKMILIVLHLKLQVEAIVYPIVKWFNLSFDHFSKMWMCCTVKLPDLCWTAALESIILKRLSKLNGFKMTCKVIRRLLGLYVFDRTTWCDSYILWDASFKSVCSLRCKIVSVYFFISDKGSSTFYFNLLLIYRSIM